MLLKLPIMLFYYFNRFYQLGTRGFHRKALEQCPRILPINSDKEKNDSQLLALILSLWAYVLAAKDSFVNNSYNPADEEVSIDLCPSASGGSEGTQYLRGSMGGGSGGALQNFKTLHRNSIFAIENHLSLAKWPP